MPGQIGGQRRPGAPAVGAAASAAGASLGERAQRDRRLRLDRLGDGASRRGARAAPVTQPARRRGRHRLRAGDGLVRGAADGAAPARRAAGWAAIAATEARVGIATGPPTVAIGAVVDRRHVRHRRPVGDPAGGRSPRSTMLVVADLDLVALAQRRRRGDLAPVDPDAGEAGQILDVERAVLPGEPRVLARDVALGQPDGVPSCRPMVISSRASGTTVVLPSSSSMLSLNTARPSKSRGPFDCIRRARRSQWRPEVDSPDGDDGARR